MQMILVNIKFRMVDNWSVQKAKSGRSRMKVDGSKRQKVDGLENGPKIGHRNRTSQNQKVEVFEDKNLNDS